ncbi:MAG: uracil-DNA glycosylase [Candidatus Portnoybacteria bacterium]|nr:uracil-DNA glycosylase [Candidatus Portnoybacteria bacterium]MDD4982650.1 uracil-DNA glycosylase [Candidatus Portnoybacteria bacterium]
MDQTQKDKLLLAIKEEVIACQKCGLYKSRVLPVVGQGNHDAQVMFIGEAPGANEAKTGVPFCGSAGKILDQLLASVGIKREEVYIANILKDRPPGNREPAPDEIAACTPYLLRQIAIINPKIIATLGNYSTHFILDKFGVPESQKGISQLRGRKFAVQDPQNQNSYTIIPLFHPAVAVYDNSKLDTLKQDFKIIKEHLK